MTKISEARNLGPKSESELNQMGINSLEQMIELGWKKVCLEYIYFYPDKINLNMITAIIGAIYNQDWRNVDPELKKEALEMIKAVRK